MLKMATQEPIATCLICKHTLLSKLNIFKTRTNFSKTLVSSKLSKLVQAPLRADAMAGAQDICTSCSALINQVDECEIKLMALENEVKLKYKMPFPIEVHSRRSDAAATAGEPGEGPPVPPPDGPTGAPDAPPADQEFSFISIDGGGLENPTIVLETGEVDVGEGNVVVYREPYTEQLNYDQSMSYLAQLEASELHHDNTDSDHGALGSRPHQEDQQPQRAQRRRGAKRSRAGREGADDLLDCDLCDETFTTMSSLRAHKACHANDKSFTCRFCHRVFSTNIALHYHWNEEHPLKLQPCPYCDKRFINKSNLNQHINTHQDPRFGCEQCVRQFHTRGDLRKHMVFKHSDAKNFRCPDCELSFKVNWLLTRHRVRVHSRT